MRLRAPACVLGAIGALGALVSGVACGPAPQSPALRDRTVRLNVFAASSLTEVMAGVVGQFEKTHKDAIVHLTFGGSSDLVRQVTAGADADVIVTADQETMQRLVDEKKAENPLTVARNRLEILVEKGNPKNIGGLRDLGRHDVVLVMCAPEVPCGKLGDAALAKAGVEAEPASREQNVKAVVAKVTLGEADAGIVYATDVAAASSDKTEGVGIGDLANDPALQAVYPAAVIKGSAHPATARAFVMQLLTPDVRTLLDSRGFLAP